MDAEGQGASRQENNIRQQSVNVPERREEHSAPSCDLDNVVDEKVQDKGVHGEVFNDLLRLARWVFILLPWLGQGDIEEADEEDLTEGVCPDSVHGSCGRSARIQILNSSGDFKRMVPSLNTESPRMTMG